MLGLASASTRPLPHDDGEPSLRVVLDFFTCLLIAGVLIRGFIVEAYLVPSGSMAPHLLGFHKQVRCPVCGESITVGVEDDHSVPEEAACSNCGKQHIDLRNAPIEPGDRLLVHRWTYEYRRPRRWESVVFRNPNEIRRPFVKRVVGLPGESVQIKDGDVYINGKIARKSVDEFQTLALPVYDHDHRPADHPSGRWDIPQGSGWSADGSTLVFSPKGGSKPIAYRHEDLDGAVGPVRDDGGYNAYRSPWHAEIVADLALACTIQCRRGEGSLEIAYKLTPELSFLVRLIPSSGEVMLSYNGEVVRRGRTEPWLGRARRLLAGLVDQRFFIRLDGEAPTSDFEISETIDQRPSVLSAGSRPFTLQADGLELTISDLAVLRDLHYASAVAATVKPAGVRTPLSLKDDEYFVLGDNSPISNDSRAWDEPAVPAGLLIGKPIVVHWPARRVQWDALGRNLEMTLPDFARTRRIR